MTIVARHIKWGPLIVRIPGQNAALANRVLGDYCVSKSGWVVKSYNIGWDGASWCVVSIHFSEDGLIPAVHTATVHDLTERVGGIVKKVKKLKSAA